MTAGARRIVVLLAALVTVAVTGRLGLWQLDRARQKTELQAAIDTRGAMPPLPQAELARTPEAREAQVHRPVVLEGRWAAEHTVWLENRQMDGRPGFFAVTPLVIGAGGDAVLVQRGWAPRDLRDRTLLPALPTPQGAVQVEGTIAPPPARLLEFDGAGSGLIRQNLDLAAFARETGLALRPLSVLQRGGAAEQAADGLQRRWPRPAVDVHKHQGYAFQWFALAVLVTGLYVWFQLVRPRRRA
jgi:surfeit locus 1 family protein